MKNKLFECIKFGFGFYIGYEIAKGIDTALGKKFIPVIDRLKNEF